MWLHYWLHCFGSVTKPLKNKAFRKGNIIQIPPSPLKEKRVESFDHQGISALFFFQLFCVFDWPELFAEGRGGREQVGT